MSATARNVDFSGVRDGGNFNKKRIPAGDYLATITKVEDAKAKADGKPQYLFSIKINKFPSSVLPYYCKLEENQLWKLRNLLIAAGKSVPKSKIKVDVNSIVGKVIGVSIEDTEWEDKEQSEVAGVFPAAELADMPGAEEEADEDDADVSADDEDESLDDLDAGGDEPEAEEDEAEEETEEEAEEEVASDPYADLDRAELKRALKKADASFVAKKSQSDDDLRALLAAANGDADSDDEEEAEEAPAPAKKAGRKAKPTSADVSDDELDELDIDSI